MIIGEYSPRRSRGEYSPIITEPEANNCFSINTQVIISKKRKKKHFNAKIILTYSGKTTTGSHFVRRGDLRTLQSRGRCPQFLRQNHVGRFSRRNHVKRNAYSIHSD